MKKIKYICVVSLVVNVFLLGVVASPLFQKSSMLYERKPDMRILKEVSASSKHEIQALLSLLHTQRKEHRDQQRDFQQNLHALLLQNEVSKQQIRQLFQAHNDHQSKLQKNIEEKFVQMADLPASDRASLVHILSKHGKRRRHPPRPLKGKP
ncbi:MAG: periplasmic heavy metal sensor [Deltaproteobacteria bacterium]|nr:periplasmic heavy metal sensor [Deltaproteobacteria bacterium]